MVFDLENDTVYVRFSLVLSSVRAVVVVFACGDESVPTIV